MSASLQQRDGTAMCCGRAEIGFLGVKVDDMEKGFGWDDGGALALVLWWRTGGGG